MMLPSRLSCLVPALLALASAAAQSWTQQFPGTPPDLLAVATDGAATVVAVGNAGAVARSTDRGLTWSDHSAVTSRLSAVAFLTPSVVLAGGDGLFRSADGGVTWTLAHPATGVQDIHPVGVSRAYAVTASGFVLQSTDEGRSWSLSPLPAGWFGAAHSVSFESATHGWIVGQGGQMLRTTDGGQTWASLPSPTSSTLYGAQREPGAVKFLLEDSGTHRGTVNNWSYSLFPWVTNARDFHIVGDFGLVVGLSGRIMLTTNNAVNWIFAYDDGGYEHEGVVVLDSQVAVVVGEDGRILRTSDGGFGWTLVRGGNAAASPWIRGLAQSDPDTLFAACTGGVVLRTDDAGATWSTLQAGTTQTHLRAVDSFDGQNIIAVGERQGFYPTICYSSDGGLNWNELNQVGMYDFYDVEALSPTVALVASETRIWRTTNAGATWTPIAPTPYTDFHALDFPTPTTGWAVGLALFRSNDAGLTWTWSASAPQRLFGVSFSDVDRGWAVGAGGLVMRTTDGGLNWTQQSAGTSAALTSVQALTSSAAYVVAVDGRVYATIDGGATWSPAGPAGLSSDPLNAVVGTTQALWVAGDFDAGIWRLTSQFSGCSGVPYCTGKVHSLGGVASMASFGIPSVQYGVVGIGATGGIPNTVGIGFESRVGPAALPLWNGTLCVQAPLQRLPVMTFDGLGFAYTSLTMDSTFVGQSRWYQFVFRDVNATDGTGLGLSNGLRLTFCP